MENKFTPEAKKRWDVILPQHRTILQQNVWCPECRNTTTMIKVSGTVEGNTLTSKVDMAKEFGPSSSGKTIIFASTEGNVSIPNNEEVKVGLNVYRKK